MHHWDVLLYVSGMAQSLSGSSTLVFPVSMTCHSQDAAVSLEKTCHVFGIAMLTDGYFSYRRADWLFHGLGVAMYYCFLLQQCDTEKDSWQALLLCFWLCPPVHGAHASQPAGKKQLSLRGFCYLHVDM
jgi:hypothetical protein